MSNLRMPSGKTLVVEHHLTQQKLLVLTSINAPAVQWSSQGREPSKIQHSLYQLVSQRVYQIVGGYEDTHDSHYLRHER